MRRCRTCVIPDTRPDTHFDATGQCSACSAYDRRPQIDWDARKKELLDLLERHRGRCIVPSSGGKDSHYQVLTLLELGARPIVVTASTCHLTATGRANIDNLARYAETVEFTPNMMQRAKLNRLGLEMVGDISWPEHCAIFSVPFRAAVALNIPLMFYGENPQSQYGGPPGTQEAREMTMRWRSEFGGFLGLRPQDLASAAGDMSYYLPPSAMELDRVGVEAHFLGQYLPWDSHRNAEIAITAGMRAELPCPANWWAHENQDNAQTGLHDHMMWRKYGYGRGAAQISVDVRAGKLSREKALTWVRNHDGVFPYAYGGVSHADILARIGVDRREFWRIADQFTNWSIFRRVMDDEEALPMLIEESACSPSE